MKNKEFVRLRNSIAIKAVIRIVLYSLISMILLGVFVDIIFNDRLANTVVRFDRDIYYWCVVNKTLLMTIAFFVIFAIVSFLVIRNISNNITAIISAMDKVLKEPENEITLPNDLVILENRLNNIRADLVKNQNNAKEQMQKKNDLIMYMAHDLKTPLTSIIGYLTLINDEKNISDTLKEKYINIALKKSLRVEELINQFFDITRYNLQDMPITKQNINLSMLIKQLIEESYPMLQEKKLKCDFNYLEDVMYVGDGDKLARAFGNLLKNAISYSYENTCIDIKIFEDTNNIKIIFRNKGDKIPEYKLKQLFDKFYRGDEARTSNNGGAGLGLAITKQIIELHGGNINVKNDDEYIEFYIELKK
ncbi:MAG: HAMP domain-containing histidine kinase [Clostridia bacterium]|nr:HAMP domain-containing histidine kinase [Clostridia bacterium]